MAGPRCASTEFDRRAEGVEALSASVQKIERPRVAARELRIGPRRASEENWKRLRDPAFQNPPTLHGE